MEDDNRPEFGFNTDGDEPFLNDYERLVDELDLKFEDGEWYCYDGSGYAPISALRALLDTIREED